MSELYTDNSDSEDISTHLIYNISELAHMYVSSSSEGRIYAGKNWQFLKAYVPENWVFVQSNHVQDCEYHLNMNDSTLFFIDYQIPELQTFIQSYLDTRAKN